MNILASILLVLLEIVPKGDAFLRPLQKRDSIYVGDRLEYGFELDNVRPGTDLALQDLKSLPADTLALVRDWKVDTTRFRRRAGLMNIRGSVLLAPFEEGDFALPPIYVQRKSDGKTDTLVSKTPVFRVAQFPLDSARIAENALAPVVRYPLTYAELFPWLAGADILLIALIVGLVLWRRRKRREEEKPSEPAHITALRKLDGYRGSQYWAPEKQKGFYSGVTDALKNYMESRFGVDAPEMTTAEVFDALKGAGDISPELFDETRELFETADFVKFAKHTAPDEYNAKVVPTAVKFVTDTYRSTLEEEQEGDVL